MYWSKGPNRLTYKINEIVPNLLKRGIEIVTGEKINGQRVIMISRIDSIRSDCQKEDEHNSNSTLSDNFIEPLSSCINLYIHRKGSSDIFECEKCPLTGDIYFYERTSLLLECFDDTSETIVRIIVHHYCKVNHITYFFKHKMVILMDKRDSGRLDDPDD
jgi:hypothetical protein